MLGKGLIYRTFGDEADPKKAFERMCGATGLADVLSKRFAGIAIARYDLYLSDKWNDEDLQVDAALALGGVGNVADMSEGESYDLGVRNFPDMGKMDEWKARAEKMYRSCGAASKALYEKMHSYTIGNGADITFTKLVDKLFGATTKKLFNHQQIERLVGFVQPMVPGIPREEPGVNAEAVFEAIYKIGKMLGVYIVCLWKLRRDVNAFHKEHGIEYTRVFPAGWRLADGVVVSPGVAKRADEMHGNFRTLRGQIAYATDVILDPDTAVHRFTTASLRLR